jgi:hypothetical protein
VLLSGINMGADKERNGCKCPTCHADTDTDTDAGTDTGYNTLCCQSHSLKYAGQPRVVYCPSPDSTVLAWPGVVAVMLGCSMKAPCTTSRPLAVISSHFRGLVTYARVDTPHHCDQRSHPGQAVSAICMYF